MPDDEITFFSLNIYGSKLLKNNTLLFGCKLQHYKRVTESEAISLYALYLKTSCNPYLKICDFTLKKIADAPL